MSDSRPNGCCRLGGAKVSGAHRPVGQYEAVLPGPCRPPVKRHASRSAAGTECCRDLLMDLLKRCLILVPMAVAAWAGPKSAVLIDRSMSMKPYYRDHVVRQLC